METFRAMIPSDLPPVGHKICLRANRENPLQDLLAMHQYWVDSGTSALALALADAKEHFPHVQNPRVIIPGYCCPDLVSACVYAGVEPVAVDINVNDPAYDLEQLSAQLDERVVAVVAVNFLGIAERLAELRQLISELGLQARLIEDNAQWFPAEKAAAVFESDYVVFSFGRGKPLSLLGGGLLLASAPVDSSVVRKIVAADAPSSLLPLKIRAYNALLNPAFYFLLNRNPVFKLGQTKYSPLESIQFIDDFRLELLRENFKAYGNRQLMLADTYHAEVSGGHLQQLASMGSVRVRRLLRYPLLCSEPSQRDVLLDSMNKAGLGASAMYPAAINNIAGVDGRVTVPVALTNAEHFAKRFMTLPVHSGVTAIHREKILLLLRNAK